VAQRLAAPLDGSQPSLEQLTVDALVKAIELTEVAR
jgi:hypothetical protein